MTKLQLRNNKLLMINGKLVLDNECCCDSEVCCCERLYLMIPPPDMTATIIAPGCAIDGAVSPMPLVGSAGTCLRWVTTGFDSDCTPPVSIGFELICPLPAEEQNNCMLYRMNGGASASGCRSGSLRYNVPPDECTCGQGCDESDPFYALFSGFSALDRFPGAGCNCCASFSVLVEEVC